MVKAGRSRGDSKGFRADNTPADPGWPFYSFAGEGKFTNPEIFG